MIRIDVTAEDIAAGCREDPWSCPIALAMCRAMSGADKVAVDRQSVEIGDVVVDLPSRARDFVRHFDEGDDVEPFSFDFDDWSVYDAHTSVEPMRFPNAGRNIGSSRFKRVEPMQGTRNQGKVQTQGTCREAYSP